MVKNEEPTLFGREWLESIRLDWPLLQLETSGTIPALEEVLSKHASVSSEGLGKMKNIQAQIHIKESARPRFWKARPIALARIPAVDEASRDLRHAYLQMEVEEHSRPFLTINTTRGLYQYQRLPYGVASAPAI